MKRFLTTIARAALILAMTAFIPSNLRAQDYETVPVTISKEKIRVGGQICYSHIVLEKQTLFSICKAYNVTTEDIYRFNPDVRENGLKKNSILIIPAVSEPSDPVEVKIASQPEKVAKPQKPVKVTAAKKRTHTVKWYEDIDMIAEKYGVPASAIMNANSLTDKRLAKRQKLIIPDPGEYSAEDAAAESWELATAADTTAVSDTLAMEEDLPSFFYTPKKEIDLNLLLPLNATGTTASRQNMDFYSGVLLAVYDMAKEGVSTSLNVYDVAGGNLPEAEALMNGDITIGPVAPGDINNLFMDVPRIKAIISPLDSKAEGIAHNWKSMIQAPAPQAAQIDDLLSWLKDDLQADDKVFVFSEKGARPSESVANMNAAIDSSGISYTPVVYSILEGRMLTDTLHTFLDSVYVNRVLIASESEAFVNDVVRNMNVGVHQKFDVKLYSLSRIRNYETIEVENFHNTKMRVSAGYYIDYEDPKVQSFLLHYRALFNTEPTQYAYQGYDIAKYFIGMCSKYGDRWMEMLDREEASMLQSTFRFERTPHGGYVNKGVRRIVYGDNWAVDKIR